jgi:hypothetical protein
MSIWRSMTTASIPVTESSLSASDFCSNFTPPLDLAQIVFERRDNVKSIGTHKVPAPSAQVGNVC